MYVTRCENDPSVDVGTVMTDESSRLSVPGALMVHPSGSSRLPTPTSTPDALVPLSVARTLTEAPSAQPGPVPLSAATTTLRDDALPWQTAPSATAGVASAETGAAPSSSRTRSSPALATPASAPAASTTPSARDVRSVHPAVSRVEIAAPPLPLAIAVRSRLLPELSRGRPRTPPTDDLRTCIGSRRAQLRPSER